MKHIYLDNFSTYIYLIIGYPLITIIGFDFSLFIIIWVAIIGYIFFIGSLIHYIYLLYSISKIKKDLNLCFKIFLIVNPLIIYLFTFVFNYFYEVYFDSFNLLVLIIVVLDIIITLISTSIYFKVKLKKAIRFTYQEEVEAYVSTINFDVYTKEFYITNYKEINNIKNLERGANYSYNLFLFGLVFNLSVYIGGFKNYILIFFYILDVVILIYSIFYYIKFITETMRLNIYKETYFLYELISKIVFLILAIIYSLLIYKNTLDLGDYIILTGILHALVFFIFMVATNFINPYKYELIRYYGYLVKEYKKSKKEDNNKES